MRVFSVPSVPFLRSVIAALVDGRLVEGFEARAESGKAGAGDALSADPARRTDGAGDLSRRARHRRRGLPRIVALGDIDEDELASRSRRRLQRPGTLEIPPAMDGCSAA